MDGSFVGERPLVEISSSELDRLEAELSKTKDEARAACLRARIAEIRSKRENE